MYMYFKLNSLCKLFFLFTDYFIMRSYTSSSYVVVYKEPFRHKEIIGEQWTIWKYFLLAFLSKLSMQHVQVYNLGLFRIPWKIPLKHFTLFQVSASSTSFGSIIIIISNHRYLCAKTKFIH